MGDPELVAVAASLKGSHRRVLEVLVLAGDYLNDLAEHDERAAWLAGEIARAFEGLSLENSCFFAPLQFSVTHPLSPGDGNADTGSRAGGSGEFWARGRALCAGLVPLR